MFENKKEIISINNKILPGSYSYSFENSCLKPAEVPSLVELPLIDLHLPLILDILKKGKIDNLIKNIYLEIISFLDIVKFSYFNCRQNFSIQFYLNHKKNLIKVCTPIDVKGKDPYFKFYGSDVYKIVNEIMKILEKYASLYSKDSHYSLVLGVYIKKTSNSVFSKYKKKSLLQNKVELYNNYYKEEACLLIPPWEYQGLYIEDKEIKIRKGFKLEHVLWRQNINSTVKILDYEDIKTKLDFSEEIYTDLDLNPNIELSGVLEPSKITLNEDFTINYIDSCIGISVRESLLDILVGDINTRLEKNRILWEAIKKVEGEYPKLEVETQTIVKDIDISHSIEFWRVVYMLKSYYNKNDILTFLNRKIDLLEIFIPEDIENTYRNYNF